MKEGKAMTELETKFLDLLKAATQSKASDIHLATGMAPSIRASEGNRPRRLSALKAVPYARSRKTNFHPMWISPENGTTYKCFLIAASQLPAES